MRFQTKASDEKTVRRIGLLENLFIVILAFYPLRHINWGLDLWDTGYNYANFQYMGTEHMDSMWLFSTYLSNAVGKLLTGLPSAGSLLGMNFYTGLFVSFLALMGYFFCIRSLGMPKWCAFLGELAAMSLCWCPTALLYNYLTYVLFGACVVLLYRGLTQEKPILLVIAGACLGANVLVRFSNLPEAALILAVWVYDVILRRESKSGGRKCGIAAEEGQKLWRRLGQHTFWCFAGYGSALLMLLGYIHVRYGFGNYVAGIRRLFSMTEHAEDYKATSMLMGMIGTYVENLYWVIRIGVILAAGIALFAVVAFLTENLQKLCRILWAAVSLAMVVWLYVRGFCSFRFFSYDAILRPGILFLMLTMFIGVIRFFHRDSAPEERLISAMVILVVLLTSIGSNNGVYPSMNNLFLAAPYTLWQSWRFMRNVTGKRVGGLVFDAFPAKGLLVAFLLMCLFQFGGFGVKFVFAEATGVQDISAAVENNEILKNIRMSPDKAKWLTELSDYVNENELQGREVILYGYVPSLSYYLQMPSAFNPWSDLDSYSYEAMEAAIQETEAQMTEQSEERPVVLADCRLQGLSEDKKWQLIVEFMERNGYEQTWQNDRFTIWE